MSLNGLHFKCNWLEENIDPIKLLQLNNICTNIMNSLKQELNFETSTTEAFVSDLLYCLCRHKQWLYTDVFQKVALDSFSEEYNKDKKTLNIVLKSLIPEFQKILCIKQNSYLNNVNFLKYIFIHTVTSEDDQRFSIHFGLGHKILEKLKNAAQAINEKESFVFLPDIDAKYSELISQLSLEYSKTPWIFDAYLLQFELIEIKEPWQTLIIEKNTTWLLRMLLKIHLNGRYTKQQFFDDINKTFPIFQDQDYETFSLELLNQLQKKTLIYEDHSNKRKTLLRLTSKAYQLTAEFYYHSVYKKEDQNLEAIKDLNGSWQSHIFVRDGSKQVERLQKMFDSNDAIKPESIPTIINLLKSQLPEATLLEMLEKKLEFSQTPWVRAAACEALGKLPTKLAKDRLINICKQDESVELKKLATHILLERHQHYDSNQQRTM